MNTRRLELFTDTLMILFCVLLPHVARLPMFAYPAIVLLAVWGYLRWKRQTFADIGFRWKDLHFKAVLVGAGIGVLWTAFVIFVLGPGLLKLTGLPPADLHDFYFIRDDRAKFIQLLLIACVWVIPYEEIIFRGFMLYTTRRWMPLIMASLVTSILFAFYHWQEGASAVITIFLGALLSVWLLKRFRFNLWYVIFFHITYDVIMLSLVRYGYLK